MKNTIVVTTDFSATAANALSYACQFATDHHLHILLANIYSIPANYAGEGLSVASIKDAMDADQELLLNEINRVKLTYPALNITARMMTGGLLESLDELKNTVNAAMIVMGAVGEYADLWLWDDNWLNALISVSCPVLVVPQHIQYRPIKAIAFACDYKKACLPAQTDAITKLVKLTGADLYVINVTSSPSAQQPAITNGLQAAFSDLKPHYQTIENKLVIRGIAEFVQQHEIDLLLVIPQKHGLWHSLFNKSYTKQLAQLNNLPVMAIHEE